MGYTSYPIGDAVACKFSFIDKIVLKYAELSVRDKFFTSLKIGE